MRIYLSAQIKTLGRAFACPCRCPPFDRCTFLRRGREKNISCHHFAQLVEILTSQKFSKVGNPQKSAARVSPPRVRETCFAEQVRKSQNPARYTMYYIESVQSWLSRISARVECLLLPLARTRAYAMTKRQTHPRYELMHELIQNPQCTMGWLRLVGSFEL